MMGRKVIGSQVLIESLIASDVKVVFGYPGGTIMPTYDALYDYQSQINHVLVRHEQAAVHAAEGYARATGRVGVCLVTSGPGATNTVTGIADAMMDSTPLVVITGQVASPGLGIDLFQEVNIVGVTHPITKWNILVRRSEDIAPMIARAIYIAQSGRPGPVLVDITKDAQIGAIEDWGGFVPCRSIRSYRPVPTVDKSNLMAAAELINAAQKPMIIFGQGVTISGAEDELERFVNKSGIPATATLLGLSALDYDNPHYIGMIGMHGNYAANITNQECDLIVAVGMRFDDRVVSNADTFAANAKIIHIDIDPAEIDKIVTAEVGIIADAKDALSQLTECIEERTHSEWLERMHAYNREERRILIEPYESSDSEEILMHQAVLAVDSAYEGDNITVTDVGQHQMFAARYMSCAKRRSIITSGGLGSMGYGLPAAIGAKIGMPDREVILFIGDGGMQMNMQELATIMQEQVSVKIVLLNNSFLGMVRQWQQLFFDRRYSFTSLANPRFDLIAEANSVGYGLCEKRSDLASAVEKMKSATGTYILEVRVKPEDNIFPMVPGGKSLCDMIFKEQ